MIFARVHRSITLLLLALQLVLAPAVHARAEHRPEHAATNKQPRENIIRDARERRRRDARAVFVGGRREARRETRRDNPAFNRRGRAGARGDFVNPRYRGTYPVPVHAAIIARRISANRGRVISGYEGGEIFHNEHRALPRAGSYREYDVHPLGSGARGSERLVRDGHTGRIWYTNDHYDTFVPLP